MPEDSPLVFFRLSATFKKASLKTGRDEGSHSYALKYQLIFVYLNWDSCTIPTGTSAGCQLTICDAAHHCITVFAPTCREILQTDGMVASTHACSPPPPLRTLPFPCSARGRRPTPHPHAEYQSPAANRGSGPLPGALPVAPQLRNPLPSGREGAKQTAAVPQLGPLRQ